MDMNYRGGMGEAGEWAGWSGVGGEWDNCNSIMIKKYIFKKCFPFQMDFSEFSASD